MNSTCNWLRRHRLATLTAAAALTGLMLAPNFAQAGHRRHASNCCCGNYGYSGYGHSNYGHSNYGYSNHGYSSNYGYNNRGYSYGGTTWSQPGYAQSGIQYGDSYAPSQPTMSGQTYSGQGDIVESQPSIAATPQQGEQITAARPNLEDGQAVPPAPNPGVESEAAAGENPQTRQQLQQRVNELEQENARLKQQLDEARQQNDAAQSAVDTEPAPPAAESDATEAADDAAEAASETSVEAESPELPEGKQESPVESQTEK